LTLKSKSTIVKNTLNIFLFTTVRVFRFMDQQGEVREVETFTPGEK
jgi:hypothetical protein